MKLIAKDTVIAEIKRLSQKARELYGYSQFNDAYNKVLESIDTLQVKEVGNNLWKSANGDCFPEIDREVIVLLTNGKVCFAHRPNPDGWDGKSITTGEVKHYDVQTYDNGRWNIPDVKFWLDLELPKMEE